MKLVLVPDCIDRAEDGFETAEGVFGEMVDRVGASISYCVPRSFEALGAGGRAGCASDNCDGLPVFDRRSRGGGVHAFRSDLIGRHTREPLDDRDQAPGAVAVQVSEPQPAVGSGAVITGWRLDHALCNGFEQVQVQAGFHATADLKRVSCSPALDA